MPELYKLYLLDDSGRIVRPFWIEAEDDGSAFARASTLCTLNDGELWLEKRKVGAIPRLSAKQQVPRAEARAS